MLQVANQHHPGAAQRLAGHFNMFRKLWRNAVIRMDKVLSAGGDIANEWPASCSYWGRRDVKAFVKKHGLEEAKIHGCALGKKGPKGQPQYKPWTICTSSRALRDGLHLFRCKRNHVH